MGFVAVLPLPLIFDPPVYLLHFTICNTFHREATLKTALELLDYSVRIRSKEIDHRVYQIHKCSGVVNGFLTARRYFLTSSSERTQCMENRQSVFFLSPHMPYRHMRLAQFTRIRLFLHAFLISLLIL